MRNRRSRRTERRRCCTAAGTCRTSRPPTGSRCGHAGKQAREKDNRSVSEHARLTAGRSRHRSSSSKSRGSNKESENLLISPLAGSASVRGSRPHAAVLAVVGAGGGRVAGLSDPSLGARALGVVRGGVARGVGGVAVDAVGHRAAGAAPAVVAVADAVLALAVQAAVDVLARLAHGERGAVRVHAGREPVCQHTTHVLSLERRQEMRAGQPVTQKSGRNGRTTRELYIPLRPGRWRGAVPGRIQCWEHSGPCKSGRARRGGRGPPRRSRARWRPPS